MHTLAEEIENNGSLELVCPHCGFMWDAVKLYNLITDGGDVVDYLATLKEMPVNEPARNAVEDDGVSPIARLLANNGDAMDETIDRFGAEYVANWFFAVAAGIAARYSLAPIGDEHTPYQAVTEETK
jgi:hypothetical protein